MDIQLELKLMLMKFLMHFGDFLAITTVCGYNVPGISKSNHLRNDLKLKASANTNQLSINLLYLYI